MDKFQAVMDQAYSRHGDLSRQAFWDQLDAKERIAVFIGNMNYQVENGGWTQWMYNGYATAETVGFIERKLEEVNTEESKIVVGHLQQIRALAVDSGWDLRNQIEDDYIDSEIDKMASEFYQVNSKLMEQVEEKFFS